MKGFAGHGKLTANTGRFNKKEEEMYFFIFIKELIAEKLEDLRDIGTIKSLKEGKPSDHLGADQVTPLFKY